MNAPRVSIIAATARNGVIGRNNGIPWRLPDDLSRFKQLTSGHPVIMGRKTFESILAMTGKPLPGRENIVVTRSAGYPRAGCRVVHSLEAALAEAGKANEAFVIGGAELYALALPLAQRLYLTEIDADFEGDAVFPRFDRSAWSEIAREPRRPAAEGSFRYDFAVYERIRPD
jgi:dihydrofolate reductase